GMIFMFVLDVSIPHTYMAEGREDTDPSAKIRRTGLLLALGIGIHNFPEGMATFAGALKDQDLGIAMAIAIAVHNIPEGIAVSAPIFAATGSRSTAFLYSLFSGIAEPVGALLAASIFYSFLTTTVLSWVLAGIAGLMVFISLDELVPAAKEYGHDHLAVLSVILGMAVMMVSLLLLAV
ncbi:ZIP family metal transporter, partial [Candidatus Eisenbacteria bacterium]